MRTSRIAEFLKDPDCIVRVFASMALGVVQAKDQGDRLNVDFSLITSVAAMPK